MLTTIRSNMPQMNRYPEIPGIKPLFHSVRDIALILDKTVQGGYGYLKSGTVMAVNASAAGGKGKLVPYVPYAHDVAFGADSAIGIAPCVKDGISSHVYTSINDSYMFEVGDELALQNVQNDLSPVTSGAIISFDRTTSPLWADITVTTAYTATEITIAHQAYARLVTGSGGELTTPVYILDKDIDTGYGSEALGALTSVVVSNCVLYKNSLINLTAEAIAALTGSFVDGRFFIMK
jgi:hypothetical protein